jgi:hypothetical protein
VIARDGAGSNDDARGAFSSQLSAVVGDARPDTARSEVAVLDGRPDPDARSLATRMASGTLRQNTTARPADVTSSALNRSRSARPTAQNSSVRAGRRNLVTTDNATSPQSHLLSLGAPWKPRAFRNA